MVTGVSNASDCCLGSGLSFRDGGTCRQCIGKQLIVFIKLVYKGVAMLSYSAYATVLGKFNEGLFLELLTLKQSSHYIAAVADGFVGEVNKHLLALLAYMLLYIHVIWRCHILESWKVYAQ